MNVGVEDLMICFLDFCFAGASLNLQGLCTNISLWKPEKLETKANRKDRCHLRTGPLRNISIQLLGVTCKLYAANSSRMAKFCPISQLSAL